MNVYLVKKKNGEFTGKVYSRIGHAKTASHSYKGSEVIEYRIIETGVKYLRTTAKRKIIWHKVNLLENLLS